MFAYIKTGIQKLSGMKCFFKTVVLFLLISGNVSAQPVQTVPDFIFFNLNKTAFTNKSLEPGKKIFFVFFDTECDHCQHAIQYINQHLSGFKKAAIYLITLDSPEKTTPFMAKYGSNLKNKKYVTLLQDLNNEFLRKFRPRKYPSLFLYSEQKKLILYDDNEQNLFRFTQEINKTVK